MPRIRSVSDVKANLLRPALTSHYEVFIGIPSRDKNGKSSRQFVDYLSRNKITWTISQDKIHLSCSEALLPGSSFATHELTGVRTGVTERHIYRRVYDDRIDLTFYIDTGSLGDLTSQMVPSITSLNNLQTALKAALYHYPAGITGLETNDDGEPLYDGERTLLKITKAVPGLNNINRMIYYQKKLTDAR